MPCFTNIINSVLPSDKTIDLQEVSVEIVLLSLLWLSAEACPLAHQAQKLVQRSRCPTQEVGGWYIVSHDAHSAPSGDILPSPSTRRLASSSIPSTIVRIRGRRLHNAQSFKVCLRSPRHTGRTHDKPKIAHARKSFFTSSLRTICIISTSSTFPTRGCSSSTRLGRITLGIGAIFSGLSEPPDDMLHLGAPASQALPPILLSYRCPTHAYVRFGWGS